MRKSPLWRALTSVSLNFFFSSRSAGLAMLALFLEALNHCTSSLDRTAARAVRRLDEAVLVDARVGRQRGDQPMFGPSGVSIGQMRP